MGSKHQTTLFDRARDELFSHVIRCDVLAAHQEDRTVWLADTMDFMAHRYPQLSELELAQLKVMGKRFVEPAIPHGAGATATNRAKWQDAPTAVAATESDPSSETPSESDAATEPATEPVTATQPVTATEPELATAAT